MIIALWELIHKKIILTIKNQKYTLKVRNYQFQVAKVLADLILFLKLNPKVIVIRIHLRTQFPNHNSDLTKILVKIDSKAVNLLQITLRACILNLLNLWNKSKNPK